MIRALWPGRQWGLFSARWAKQYAAHQQHGCFMPLCGIGAAFEAAWASLLGREPIDWWGDRYVPTQLTYVPLRTDYTRPPTPRWVFRFAPDVEVTQRRLDHVRDALAQPGGGVIRTSGGAALGFAPTRVCGADVERPDGRIPDVCQRAHGHEGWCDPKALYPDTTDDGVVEQWPGGRQAWVADQ